jgi:hypothetical protein
LTRNGIQFSRDFLKQTHAEAFAVREYLSSKGINVPIRPMLVFSGQYSKVRFAENPIGGVYVIGSMYVRKIVVDVRHGNILTRQQITDISDILDNANIGVES